MHSSTKNRLGLALLLLLIVVSAPLGLWVLQNEPRPALKLRAMSFNIRNGYGKDGDNRWEFRRDFVAEVIREASPDVVGLQEAHHFQLAYLLEQLPAYASVGVGRDGGKRGEYSTILYRKARFELNEAGTFWLSNSPEQPSAHWGNRYKRICTWARLVDKRSGRAFAIYNTHMDHESQLARENGAELIMQTIASHASAISKEPKESTEPFLLMGDLNSLEDGKVVAYLKGKNPLAGANPLPLIDTWRVTHPNESASGTASRFTGSMEPLKIDYILAPPTAEVLSAAILRPKRKGRDASDHYPVVTEVRFK